MECKVRPGVCLKVFPPVSPNIPENRPLANANWGMPSFGNGSKYNQIGELCHPAIQLQSCRFWMDGAYD